MVEKKRGRAKFNMFKPLILGISFICYLLPYRFRKCIFNSFRMNNGIIAIGIRYCLFRTLVENCGDNVAIHPGVYFFGFKKLSVGNNVTFHPMCYIDATGGIVIGNDVSIAHATTVLSTSHNYDNPNFAISDQGLSFNRTIIDNNVWIGAKCTILYGVNIHSGSIVGANSLVNKDIPENVIVGGIPAKKIKNRL